jgi:hypothetical protein
VLETRPFYRVAADRLERHAALAFPNRGRFLSQVGEIEPEERVERTVLWRRSKPLLEGHPGRVGVRARLPAVAPQRVGLGEAAALSPAAAAFISSFNQLLELLAKLVVDRGQLFQSSNRLAILAIHIAPKIEDAVSDECCEVDDVNWHWPHQRDGAR